MEGSQTPRWAKAKKGSRSRDPGQKAFLMTLHPETGHQELDPQGGCPALEWPLATVSGGQPFQPCHRETSHISSPGSSAASPAQPWSPGSLARGAPLQPRAHQEQRSSPGRRWGRRGFREPDARMLGPQEQQACCFTAFFLPLLKTWLLFSQGMK